MSGYEFSADVHRIEGTGIISVKISGEVTGDDSQIVYDKTEKAVLTLDNPDEIKLLVDARDAGKGFFKSKKAVCFSAEKR